MSVDDLERRQDEVCRRFGVTRVAPAPLSKVGIALDTLGLSPLNALRHPPVADTSGWYVWGGRELSQHPEFFKPLHVKHLADRCPELVPYLGLPAGWRVQLAPGHEDVWYDAALLDV